MTQLSRTVPTFIYIIQTVTGNIYTHGNDERLVAVEMIGLLCRLFS